MKVSAPPRRHPPDHHYTRRTALGWAAATTLTASRSFLHAATEAPPPGPPVCVYTEHFQSLPIPEVCRLLAEMGVAGLDLTVRPGGHIEPRDVQVALPGAVQAAEDHGLQIMMLTTGITGPEPEAEATLATCQKLGIRHIKLGYHHVGEFGELARKRDHVRRQLGAIAKLASKYDVLPSVHVHSGPTIPSNGWSLFDLIQDLPPERIGAYLDSHHMTLTGGGGGWRQAIDLLRPWISLVALKNFQWHPLERDDLGQQRWRTEYCRLQDGVAPIPEFVQTVHAAGYSGFYTLHTEYSKPVKECLQLTREDFTFIKTVLARLPAPRP